MTAKSFAWCAALALVWASACSDDEDRVKTPPNSSAGAAAEAGAPSGGGAGPDAAGSTSLAPGGSSSMGGMPTPQSDAGGAGAGQGPSNEAGSAPQGAGGAGGTAGEYSGVEKLGLCPRLSRRPGLSSGVSVNFDYEVYHDPCVGWTTKLYEVEKARPDYLNVLNSWNLGLWGCKELGVETFALLWKQPDVLTRGDLDRLITLYVAVLNRDLLLDGQAKLSPNEEAEMRAALERLGESMVTDVTLDFSHPECLMPPGGEGGAGGAGGEGNPLAGAGGQAPGTAGHGGH